MTEFESPSPFHAGEQHIQQQLGVRERMEHFGRRVIRDYMPDQHRTFYAQLPMLLLGAVSGDGDAWASAVWGRPGFVHSPDPRTLRVDALPAEADPVRAAAVQGAAIGVLGIELHSRRRNRVNGRISHVDARGFGLQVEHAFGNCPQYVQSRQFEPIDGAPAQPIVSEQLSALDAEAVAGIRAADTCFIASYVDIDGDPARRQVDVSHRGGKPGFVRVDGATLCIPDFAGNLHFNTLGNLLLNPRAGLCFIDFERGDLLQLSGRTELIFDGPEISAFQGAERLLRFTVERVVRQRGALGLRWRFTDYSPNSLMTGSWEEAAGRLRAATMQDAWRPFRVVRVVDEAKSIRSLHLEPADSAGLPGWQAGQHLPIRIRLDNGAPLIRTYTISAAPSDGLLRISVKQAGRVSSHLHQHVRVGDVIEARAPGGGFVVDAREQRPLVLISAGIGITPMLAMLRHVVYEGLRLRRMRRTFFLHASRTLAERAFDVELGELIRRGGGAVAAVQVLSRPEDSAVRGDDYGLHGRIDAGVLKKTLPFDDHDFYLCGPPEFTQGLYDALRDLRVGDDRIHAEAFGPSSLRRRRDVAAGTATVPAATEPVRIQFLRSGKEARWEPGMGTLLELAEARGLNPEFSCRGGSCGSCRTKLLRGAVTYVRPTEATHAADEALLCCAVPAEGGDDPLQLDA